jgi:hypothetical protein
MMGRLPDGIAGRVRKGKKNISRLQFGISVMA